MKTLFIFTAFLYTFSAYSQDSMRVRHIDSLVNLINISDFEIKRDTIKQDQPAMGLFARTYLSVVVNGTELKKFSNDSHIKTEHNGVSEQTISNNTFYFDHNKLIKVEEFTTKDNSRKDAHWYYADDKPIYYTFKSEKSQARAELLLTMAKGMLEKMGFK